MSYISTYDVFAQEHPESIIVMLMNIYYAGYENGAEVGLASAEEKLKEKDIVIETINIHIQ